MRKSLGKSKLTYEELLTIIIEIEAVLNSRPLCYLYDNEVDEIITPSHLLAGRRIMSPIDDVIDPCNVEMTPSGLSKRVKYISKLVLNFTSKWQHEYLTGLREYHRDHMIPRKEISLGEVVLIEDKLPRSKWKLAVVDELLQGRDGKIRGCKLRIISRNSKILYMNRVY